MLVLLAVSVVAASLVVAWPLACGVPLPRLRLDPDERRLRHVGRRPHLATCQDLERLMRAHELPELEVRLVSDRAREAGIAPFTMWCWIEQYGVHALAVVVAADLGHEELLRHLGNGTLPDLAELQVLAALNGLHAAAPEPARAVRRSVPRARRAPGTGLQVEGPGSWPFAGWQPGDERELAEELGEQPGEEAVVSAPSAQPATAPAPADRGRRPDRRAA